MNFRTEIKRKWGANKTRNCNEKCQSDESDGKENNGAVCIVIVGYGKTTNKINQNYGWLTCDVCGGYACPKCSPNGLDENNDTVISSHREILKLHLIKHWLSECKRIRTHNHLVCNQTLNHLPELVKWLSCFMSTYLYGALDCMFISCHVYVSEWIYTL